MSDKDQKETEEPRDVIQFVGATLHDVLRDGIRLVSAPASNGESLGMKQLRWLFLQDFCDGQFGLMKDGAFLQLVGDLLIANYNFLDQQNLATTTAGMHFDDVNQLLFDRAMDLERMDGFMDDLERVREERDTAERRLLAANELSEVLKTSLGSVRRDCLAQGKIISDVIELAEALQEMPQKEPKLIGAALLRVVSGSINDAMKKKQPGIKNAIRQLRATLKRVAPKPRKSTARKRTSWRPKQAKKR